jgi:hypothetical protein
MHTTTTDSGAATAIADAVKAAIEKAVGTSRKVGRILRRYRVTAALDRPDNTLDCTLITVDNTGYSLVVARSAHGRCRQPCTDIVDATGGLEFTAIIDAATIAIWCRARSKGRKINRLIITVLHDAARTCTNPHGSTRDISFGFCLISGRQ